MTITKDKGMWGAVAVTKPVPAPRTRVKVENLEVSARGHVTFSYRSIHTRSTVFVFGTLTDISRPVPIDDGPPQPVILMVDGLKHSVPAGTLVEIETGEIR